jgi:putative DNA primase/helicase
MGHVTFGDVGGALPRLVLFAAKNNSGALDEAKHIMVRVKSNIGPSGGGFGYHFDVADVMLGVDATRLVWEAAIEGTARELLGNAEGHPDDRVSKLDQAKAFLKQWGAASGRSSDRRACRRYFRNDP